MKLSMLSFNLVRNLPLPELLAACRKTGFAAVELRMQLEHAHGVDKQLDAAGREAVRNAFDDANLEICGLTLSNRFESPEAEQRAESVAEVKQYIELAPTWTAIGSGSSATTCRRAATWLAATC